jgi:single-strand DNA-binding protein
MKSINRVFLVGRLGDAPAVKTSKNGKPYAVFSVATHRMTKNEAGASEEKTDWHRITVWGSTAEICGQRLAKGSPVFIEGEINHWSKIDQTGQKRYQTSITAQDISFLSLPVHHVASL